MNDEEFAQKHYDLTQDRILSLKLLQNCLENIMNFCYTSNTSQNIMIKGESK